MRSSSPTPGCFSIFSRSRKATKTRPALASRDEPKPSSNTVTTVTRPAPVASHAHLDPCCCSDGLDMSKLKMAFEDLPPYTSRQPFYPEVKDTIRDAINGYASQLTEISLYLSDNPELGFHEFKAHEKITSFLEAEGFDVERHYLLETSFRASYKHGKGGRTFGYNSEYDALPGIGHACGHNLIAVAGIAALLGMRAAMKKHNIAGTVVLIGTPAEEGGVGKGILLEKGGYEGLDACMMVHPGSSQAGTNSVAPTLAIQTIEVEFFGRTAHAGALPWDGINALDAANLAYTSISVLRQQIHITDRVHGIIVRGGDAPNIIPDYTKMRYYVRATTAAGVQSLMDKVKHCFEAAALATGCTVKYVTDQMMYDLRNCKPLAEEYAATMGDLFAIPTYLSFAGSAGDFGGSTDFGNVTYALPACHPGYGIPALPGRGNHTPEFMAKCRTPEAHDLTFKAATGMSAVGARFLADKDFADESTQAWKDDMAKDS